MVEKKLEVVASHYFECKGISLGGEYRAVKNITYPVIVDSLRDGSHRVSCPCMHTQRDCYSCPYKTE